MLVSKGQYINGLWVKGSGRMLESINPADGSLIWQGTQATEAEIQTAYLAAHETLLSWGITTFEQRMHYVTQFAKQVEQHRDHLARLIALETGKPLWEAKTEVSAVIGKVNISIQAYQERTWSKHTNTPEANACIRYKPHGVVAVLGAFNFPAHLSNGHIVPALLAGNTVLYKPSELAPGVAEFIMQCWHESGIPAGAIHCLQGDVQCGKSLLEKDIQGVYFTGSYATGLAIHQQFSLKPEVILALEMGGNNPLVIDELKQIDAAVYQTILSSFITAGQRCSCARRVMIPDNHFGDEFLNQLINSTKKLVIGPFDQQSEPFMGPVISHTQALKHLQSQTMLGGQSLLQMELLKENTGLLSPGIMDMTNGLDSPDEEIFAPFIQVYRYQHFTDAIHLANKTRYGLVAALFSDDESHYQQFYQWVRAGLINWNRPTTGASSALPFGGVGRSGNHRPSAYFAADYCAYPVAGMEQNVLTKPDTLLPGIVLE